MTAAWLLAGLLAAGLPDPGATAQLAPAPPAGPAGPCGLSATAKTGEFSAFPPCTDVELTAEATGRPPITFTWTLPGGAQLHGNPAILDTGDLADGLQEIVLEVTNSAGRAEVPVQVIVEPLAFVGEPLLVQVGDGQIEMQANTAGATEWRWIWGDGSSSGWLSGCGGYAPSHVYPGPGLFVVTIQARSCRGGPISWTGVLVVEAEVTIFSDDFESGGLTRWIVP